MSDILASVSVVLGAEISGFRAAMADARKELRGLVQFSEGLKDIGSSLTQYVSAPLALLGGASLKVAGDMQALKTGFAATYKGAEPLSAALAKVQDLAKLPGLGLKEALQGATNLQAAGFSADQARKSLAAFGNALATVGKGKAELDGVSFALTQINNTPFVQGQDLNQLRNALPQIGEAMKKAFGTTSAEGLKALGVTSQQFIATITDEFGKLPAVTGGLKNAFENFADAGTLALAQIGDSLNKSLNFEGFVNTISDAMKSAVAAFAELSPGVQKVIFVLAGLAAATGPVLVAIGTLGAALPAITAGFEVLGVGSLAALGPILPVVAAIAAAAYLVIDNWGAVSAYFQSSEVTGLFNGLADAAKSAASAIGDAFSTIGANVSGNLGEMVSAATIFRTIFREAAVGVTAVLDVLAGAIKAITGLLTLDTTKAVEGATQAFYGLIDPIANLFGFSKKAPTDSGIYVLTQQAKEFNAVGPQFAANLALLNGVKLDVVASQAAEAAKRIGLLADLEARLKAAKDAQPDLTTEGEIASSNQLIASLEQQIARLKALGIASQEMKKAYAEVQKSLRTVAQESLALGDQYDYLKNRQSATESGIKRLIGAGFSPASNAVRTLVADLRNLNNTLGDNTLLSGRSLKGSEKLFETPEFKVQLPELDKLPTELKPINITPFTSSLGEVTRAMQQAQEVGESISAGFGPIIEQGLGNAAASFGEGIAGILSGTQGFNDLGAALLAGIGGMMVQLGELAIGAGIAVLGIKAALETLNPFAAIAGGIALVALGTLVGGAAKGISTSGPSGGGTGSINTSPATRASTFTPTVAPKATAAAPITYTHYVEITASGRNLAGALTLETDRFGRVVGKK